jgi:hypothetical protein
MIGSDACIVKLGHIKNMETTLFEHLATLTLGGGNRLYLHSWRFGCFTSCSKQNNFIINKYMP